MTVNEWVVRSSSFFEGSKFAYATTEITCETRAEARKVMAAQKLLARHAVLPTQISLFKVKSVILFDGDQETRFYTRTR